MARPAEEAAVPAVAAAQAEVSESSERRGKRLNATRLRWEMKSSEETGVTTSTAFAARLRASRAVRFALAAAAAVVVAVVAPAVAKANYAVQECTSGAGNADAATIRPFGGATKISQTDTCLSWGLRMEANGQSTLNTYVVWQWTAPPNTVFKTVQTLLHYFSNGGYGPMSSGSGSPGYSAVGGGGDSMGDSRPEQYKLLRHLRAVLREPVLEHLSLLLCHEFLRGRAGSVSALGERVW